VADESFKNDPVFVSDSNQLTLCAEEIVGRLKLSNALLLIYSEFFLLSVLSKKHND
jgi:hypothetical protein